jgi:hypothetical protein
VAQTFLTTEELKAAFTRLDDGLVFDPDFYGKAGPYLAQSGLDNRYLQWLYKQCLLKEPRSLNGLFYKLFFAPNMAELFKVQYKPRPPPEPVSVENLPCPVCGREHSPIDDECPLCGLRKGHWGDREAVEKARRVFLLPPDKKAAFREECAALFETPSKDIPGLFKRQKDIYRKYGIT